MIILLLWAVIKKITACSSLPDCLYTLLLLLFVPEFIKTNELSSLQLEISMFKGQFSSIKELILKVKGNDDENNNAEQENNDNEANNEQ